MTAATHGFEGRKPWVCRVWRHRRSFGSSAYFVTVTDEDAGTVRRFCGFCETELSEAHYRRLNRWPWQS